MDQHRLAGVGNLLADEILWRAGMDPAAAPPLTSDEVRALHSVLRSTLRQLDRRGGVHTGDVRRSATPEVCPRRRRAAPWCRRRPQYLVVPGAQR